MPPPRIARDSNDRQVFLTLTVRRWYYLFDRHQRWPILAEALDFAKEKKGVRLYGFVFMLNHLHLIAQAPDMAGFVRDFKRFTTARLRENLAATEPTVHDLLRGEEGGFSLWMPGNAPKIIETEPFFLQKLTYLHDNPVRKQYVAQPAHWYWSSANPCCPLKADPW
ncbi:MAG: hypothetical protein GVY28_07870 [Alphaproteobacteria bacterium]|jgi:REP element-mobilizing transposase RayT|nr:hypothetical protein [Alphaproteobacteria bacterium]